MKFSLIALVACCAVSSAAFAVSDEPGVSPPKVALIDEPGVSPPKVALMNQSQVASYRIC